ncbi:MAG: DUF2523 domain-containing protein [Pseudomonas sp.]|nr:DUF2523 domain-containing protein [Pseudomonas sp.]
MAAPALLVAGFLGSIVSGLLFRALASLGFAYVAYSGLTLLINNTKSYVVGLFSSLPVEVAQILGLARVDVALNIIFAAIIARFVLMGMDKATGALTALMLSKDL